MRWTSLVLLIACGGSSSKQPDAYVPDMLLDAPEPPVGTYRYVIDRQRVPQNNLQARDFGLDLDGDQMIDNQLGMVLGTFAVQGFDSQTPTDRAVDRGTTVLLAEMVAPDLAAGTATFTLLTGEDPMPSACAGTSDTTCRHHLNGMASFRVSAMSVREVPLAGTISGTTITAGPGHVQVPLLVLGGKPIPLNLVGARVQLKSATATTLPDVVLGGGITVAERDTKLYPGIRDNANEAIMNDCPAPGTADCGCAPGSTGRVMANLFDTAPQDCTVSFDEVRNNSLVQSLFTPDVMLESQQALSIGISLSAVHAGFQP